MSVSTDISSPELEEQLFSTMDDFPSTFCEVTEEPLKNTLLTCCSEQSMMPLIKEELKLKIQNRRLSQGKQELKVAFSPPPVYKLTPEEEVKQEIRKQRNRKSANKSRIKKKSYEENLVATVKELENKHANLEKNVKTLRTIERAFRNALMNHYLQCPIYKEKVKRLKQGLLSMPAFKATNQPIPVPTT